MNIKNCIDLLVEFFYPSNIKCILCNNPIKKDNTYSLCKSCFLNLHFIKDGCFKCGKPINNTYNDDIDLFACEFCKDKSFYFDKSISCIEYSDLSKKIVFKFKYKNQTYISKYISQIMSEKLKLEEVEFDYIVYVPIHKSKKKKRGFNQSEIIAKNISKILSKEICDCIIRKNKTKKLAGLDILDRKKELKNAFLEKENIKNVKDKNILLVDDIFTTGSTANEISKILKFNGCKNIYLLTLLTGRN